ncbi:MAG: class I SAM-dependent methyltransferase [Candidatus Omnitrophica bacterium]|nr:class I SAM-dependent methyltransferase [Candidatus Omnitrophota bacterium]
MQHIDCCPVCGVKPAFTVKKTVDLSTTAGIMHEQYAEYNLKLAGERKLSEHFAVCGSCAAVYRAFHFTEEEIRAIYTSLYLDFEDKFRNEIVYKNNDFLEGASARMFATIKWIEQGYQAPLHSVFDIGGRDGFRLKKLAANGYVCTVYDPIALNPCHPDVHKRNIWSSQLRDDETADLIVSCNVLEHCTQPRDMIRDSHQHLNKDGFLFLVLPVDFESFLEWLMCYQFVGRPLNVDVTHHVFFSERAITGLLQAQGFDVKSIRYSHMPVYGGKEMEILARKTTLSRAAVPPAARVPGSWNRFMFLSLLKVFPRIMQKIFKRLVRSAK